MTDEQEPVGSVAEEAIRLLGALQDWASENGQDSATASAGATSTFQSINEHIATGGEDCKYCPLCQLIAIVRRTSPEVRQHLSTAASSLLHAAAAAVSSDAEDRSSRSTEPFEKIDLSAESRDDPCFE